MTPRDASRSAAVAGGLRPRTLGQGAREPFPSDRPALVGFECSLATSSLEALEALDRSHPPVEIARLFDRTKALEEVAVLRTCHRFELYCWTSSPEVLQSVIDREFGGGGAWRAHHHEAAVRHLFRVAAGLESTAVGEREVRDQVRSAASRVQSRSPRPVLRPLILEAVLAADEILPRVPRSRSIAALASSTVLEESPLPFPRVLVVGSGVVGRGVAELLAPYGRVTIVYRNRPPEAEFLRSTDARAVPWDSLTQELALADAVVTAVKTRGRIIGPNDVGARSRPLAIVDLGLPRNVDPSLHGHPALRLVDLEGLRRRASASAPPAVEARVAERASSAAEKVARESFEAWVDAFRRRSEEARRSLVEDTRPLLASLSAEEWAEVERLTRRLATRLLEGPTAGLRAIPPGTEGDERRRWALALLGTRPPGS